MDSSGGGDGDGVAEATGGPGGHTGMCLFGTGPAGCEWGWAAWLFSASTSRLIAESKDDMPEEARCGGIGRVRAIVAI